MELLDQNSIILDSEESDSASTSGFTGVNVQKVNEIDESGLENISMLCDSNSDSENDNNTNNNIMAQTAQDFFRLAKEFVDGKFSGEPTELESFLDQIDLLESQTTEANRDTLVKFLLTRIVGKARETLPEVVNSVDIIKESLKTHIKPDSSQVIEGRILGLSTY